MSSDPSQNPDLDRLQRQVDALMTAAAIAEQKCQKALVERNIARESVAALEEEVNKLRRIGEGGEIAKLRKENERLNKETPT